MCVLQEPVSAGTSEPPRRAALAGDSVSAFRSNRPGMCNGLAEWAIRHLATVPAASVGHRTTANGPSITGGLGVALICLAGTVVIRQNHNESAVWRMSRFSASIASASVLPVPEAKLS